MKYLKINKPTQYIILQYFTKKYFEIADYKF